MFRKKLFQETSTEVRVRGNRNLVADKTFAGTTGDTVVSNASVASEVENVGVNLVQTGTYYENGSDLTIINSDDITAATFTGTLASGTAENLVDGNLTSGAYSNSGGNGQSFQFDFNESKDFGKVNMRGSGGTYPEYMTNDVTIDVWNGSSWLEAFTGTSLDIGAPTDLVFDTDRSGTKIRITLDDTGGVGLPGRFNIYEIIFSTNGSSTEDTYEAKLPLLVSQIYDYSTLLIKDDAGLEVGDATVNCRPVIEGTPVGSLITYGALKALGLSSSTSDMTIETQPVSTQKVATVQMTTSNTNIEQNQDEIIKKVAGVLIASLSTAGVWFMKGLELGRTATAISASTDNEGIIGVTNNAAARTITLSTADVVEGKIITIKDEAGTAGSANDIIIATEASETIDGRSSIKITKNYGWVRLYCDGTNWFIMSSDRFGTASISGTATLELDDEVIFCTANTFTVNLPTASGLYGKKYYVDNSGAGTVTLDPNSSETIDGSSTLAVAAGDSVTIVSDGSNWRLLN